MIGNILDWCKSYKPSDAWMLSIIYEKTYGVDHLIILLHDSILHMVNICCRNTVEGSVNKKNIEVKQQMHYALCKKMQVYHKLQKQHL